MTILVSMPKTSVHENHCLVFAQNNVRFPWQSTDMNPESETVSKKETPYLYFRFRIFTSNAGHAMMSLLGCHFISHLRLPKPIS